jgi:hypothetical protein
LNSGDVTHCLIDKRADIAWMLFVLCSSRIQVFFTLGSNMEWWWPIPRIEYFIYYSTVFESKWMWNGKQASSRLSLYNVNNQSGRARLSNDTTEACICNEKPLLSGMTLSTKP